MGHGGKRLAAASKAASANLDYEDDVLETVDISING